VRPTKWICAFLALSLFLQPLACCKRICPKTTGETCASDKDILYVTLNDGNQYELVEWEIGPEWITGKRELVNVVIADDGTAVEEEYFEPAKFDVSEVADLDVERVDRKSIWIVGAIAGGVAAGFMAMANIAGNGGGGSRSSGGGIGGKLKVARRGRSCVCCNIICTWLTALLSAPSAGRSGDPPAKRVSSATGRGAPGSAAD